MTSTISRLHLQSPLLMLFTGCNQEQVEATVPPTTQPTEPPTTKVGIVLRHQAQDEADAQALQILF